MTVAIYARLSPKPNGQYEGVKDQIKWGRDYAAKAWPGEPVEVFADEGISAANGDHRPDFARLREWVAAGKVDQLWVVEQSRLTRREVEWFELAADLDEVGIAEVHTNRDGVIRVYDDVAGIKAVINAGERRKMLRRLNDTLAEKAGRGEPPGVKPFGYVHDRRADGVRTYKVVPEQAEAIRYAADRILDGWSLSNIAIELDKRGLRGVHGGKIGAQSVARWMQAPTIAGLRVHSGRVVGEGNWPAILDRQTFERVNARLSGNRVVRRKDGGAYPVGERHRGKASGRRYVLTGLVCCGVCGAAMVGSVKQLRNSTKPYLLCHPSKGGRACTGIMMEKTEQHIVEALFAELDKPEFLDALASEDQYRKRRDELVTGLGDVEAQREELARMWATPGELTASEWRVAREGLREQEIRLRNDLDELPAPQLRITADEAREAWETMTLDERRAFVREYIATVSIRRATPGTHGFDSDRITIEWRRR